MRQRTFLLKPVLCSLLFAIGLTVKGQNLLPEVFQHIAVGEFLMADYKMSMVDTTKLSLSKRRQHLLYFFCQAALRFEDHDSQSARKAIMRALEYRSNQQKRPAGVGRKEYRKLIRAVDMLSVSIFRQAEQAEKEAAEKKYLLSEPIFPSAAVQVGEKSNKPVFDSMLAILRQRYTAFMASFNIEMVSDTLIRITYPDDTVPSSVLQEMAAASAALIENFVETSTYKVAKIGVKSVARLDTLFLPITYDGNSGLISKVECKVGDTKQLISIPVGSRMSYTDWLLLQMIDVGRRFELSFSEPLAQEPFVITAANPNVVSLEIHISLTKKS